MAGMNEFGRKGRVYTFITQVYEITASQKPIIGRQKEYESLLCRSLWNDV